MSIKIEPRKTYDNHEEGGWSYIRIGGQLREDLKKISVWANKSMQEVGADLLEQSVAVVMPTIPKGTPSSKPIRTMGKIRRKP